jgi:uncharacterized protein (DUF2147 family)
LVLAGAVAAPFPSGDAILGIWETHDHQGRLESRVEIYKEQGKYFGKIVSLTEPAWAAGDDQGMAGKPKNDRYNPHPDLRSRPIIGMQFMRDFTYGAAKDIWVNGKIYDPKCGKTYKCKLTLTSPDRLEVRGYFGVSVFGRTDVWTR